MESVRLIMTNELMKRKTDTEQKVKRTEKHVRKREIRGYMLTTVGEEERKRKSKEKEMRKEKRRRMRRETRTEERGKGKDKRRK